jgi:hypothetical protein
MATLRIVPNVSAARKPPADGIFRAAGSLGYNWGISDFQDGSYAPQTRADVRSRDDEHKLRKAAGLAVDCLCLDLKTGGGQPQGRGAGGDCPRAEN